MSSLPRINKGWTLFLDRDGVINKRLPGDYVKHIDEFEFIDGVLDALQMFDDAFGHIIVVTNQQGIGKGVMSERQLFLIHEFMLAKVFDRGGRIDHICYCSEKAEDDPHCRKPNTGMAEEAKEKFPDIDFKRSIMVGDSQSDMEFGQRLGMHCAFIGDDPQFDCYGKLIHFAQRITSQ